MYSSFCFPRTPHRAPGLPPITWQEVGNMNICQYPTHNPDSHHTSAADSFNSKPEHRNTLDTIYNIYPLGSGGHHGTQHQPPPRPHLPLPPRRARLPGVKPCHVIPCNENICAAILKIYLLPSRCEWPAPESLWRPGRHCGWAAARTRRTSAACWCQLQAGTILIIDNIISTGLHNIYWLQGRRAAGGGGAVSGAWRCRAAPAPSCGPGPSSWGTSRRGSAPSRWGAGGYEWYDAV